MDKVRKLLNEQAEMGAKLIKIPEKFSTEAVERWLDQMHEHYGIDYRPIKTTTQLLFGDQHDDSRVYRLQGLNSVLQSIEQALVAYADETAEPDTIINKVYELTVQGGLKIEDSIRHCTNKFGKSYDEISSYVLKHYNQINQRNPGFWHQSEDAENLAEQIKRLSLTHPGGAA